MASETKTAHTAHPPALVERVADLALGHLTNEEMANKVRMLMRTDLDHEAVCVGARDRIRYLHKHLNAMVEAVNRKAAEFLAERERADRVASGHAEMIAALAFAASCIKSGERWTETCEQIIGAALAKGRASEPTR